MSEEQLIEVKPEEVPNPESRIPNPDLLNLCDLTRWVAVNAGGRRFVHLFSALTAEDWIAYDKMLRPTIRVRSDDEVESYSQALNAADRMWNEKIESFEGYPATEGRTPVGPAFVPLRHREEAVKGLGYVLQSLEQDALPDTESVTIRIEALWNGVYFKNLTHTFKRPLVEHELRFQEALRRSALISHKVGGQRRPSKDLNEFVSLPNFPTMIKLYDELIISFAGYAHEGCAMDALHKSCAVRALFNQAGTVEMEVPE
jgi:hypothetical protein